MVETANYEQISRVSTILLDKDIIEKC